MRGFRGSRNLYKPTWGSKWEKNIEDELEIGFM